MKSQHLLKVLLVTQLFLVSKICSVTPESNKTVSSDSSTPSESPIETNPSSPETSEDESKEEKKIDPNSLPFIKMYLPLSRESPDNSISSIGPCGGLVRDKSHAIIYEGSALNYYWETVRPTENGICEVRLSQANEDEESFTPLYPSKNPEGVSEFECGNKEGFEYTSFKLPKDVECEQCIVQLIWKTSYGDFYYCSDLSIIGGTIKECLGKCQHNGACIKGKCSCTADYKGDFCEIEAKHRISTVKVLVIISFIVLLILGGYLVYKNKKNLRKQFKGTYLGNWMGDEEQPPNEEKPQNSEEKQQNSLSLDDQGFNY